MFRRFLQDESGMTMGLTVIVIVLIGVMGAGLLTFVQRDLNAVVEVNQGQKAFDIADAGIAAAKRQLKTDNYTTSKYDGGTGDIQWSSSVSNTSCPEFGNSGVFGVCLRNLDGSASTTDAANVVIQYTSNTFKVTSTGQYGDAKRKVEATLRSSSSYSGGGIPTWYTPGGMRIKKEALADGVSFFAVKNIVLRKDSGTTGISNDILGDWYRPPYNTTRRTDSSGAPYTKTGLAAEGRVLCENSGGSDSVCGSSDTTGIRYYDSTTATKFVGTPTLQPQPQNEITYPFSREVNVDGLLAKANSGSPNLFQNVTSNKYSVPDSATKRVVFVDANGGTVDLAGSVFNGILIIRCGDLDMGKDATFNGIVILVGREGAGACAAGKLDIKKILTFNGTVYVGSEDGRAIDMNKRPIIGPLPSGYEDFSNLAFISSVETVSWRELYQ